MVDLAGLHKITSELAEEVEQLSKMEHEGEDFLPVLDMLKLIFDSLKSSVAIVDRDHNLLYFNPAAERITLKRRGSTLVLRAKCYICIFNIDKPCKDCTVSKAISTKKVQTNLWHSDKSGKDYYQTCIPLRVDGVTGVIEILEENKNAK